MMEFKIDDMTCDHCTQTITRAVVAVDAQADLKFDLPSHQVQILSDASPDAFKDAIERAGYGVRDVNPELNGTPQKTGCCCAPSR